MRERERERKKPFYENTERDSLRHTQMEQRHRWVLTNMRSYGGRKISMSCDSFFMFVAGSIGNFLEWFASLALPGQTKLIVSVTRKNRAMSSTVFV